MTRFRSNRAVLAALAIAMAGSAVSGSAKAGERTPRTNYILRCSGCHGMEGAGSPIGGIPDFRGMVGGFAGLDDGRTYVMHVPGVVNASLSDKEIAGVVNYIMTTYAGRSLPAAFVPFTQAEVTRRRALPVKDVVRLRRDVAKRLNAEGIVTAEYPWP